MHHFWQVQLWGVLGVQEAQVERSSVRLKSYQLEVDSSLEINHKLILRRDEKASIQIRIQKGQKTIHWILRNPKRRNGKIKARPEQS